MSKSLFSIILIFCCYGCVSQLFSDFSKNELEDDISFLYTHLVEVHPNAEVMNEADLSEFVSNLTSDYYSEIDVFFVVNGLLKKLNDGHSNVKFSNSRTKEIIEFGEFFPYELEFFDSTAVVIGAINSMHEDVLRREIFKINNVPIKEILTKLEVVAMMDGESNGSEAEWLAEDFWFYFSLYNGFRSSYSITYLENGKEFHSVTKAVSRSEYVKSSILEQFKSDPVTLDYLANIPVLKVTNFEQKSSLWWKSRLNKIFKELEDKSHEKLVLDLRENGGGQENLQNILLESFGINPASKYDYEAIKKVDFKELEGLIHKRRKKIETFGLEHFRFTSSDGGSFRVKPKKKSTSTKSPKFDGELIILIDGTTFSCASDAASILEHQYENSTLIGTETRGSGKVNYAGYFMHIALPNSGLEIRIPRVKYILHNSSCSEDSGVIPDFYVEMDKKDVQSNIDSQLSFVIQYLREREVLNH